MRNEKSVPDLLRDLVATPSVNPACLPESMDKAHLCGETRMADYLIRWGREHALETERHEALPGRPCVILTYRGSADAPVIAGFAHMDTVWTSGLEHPFELTKHDDGAYYGLGASDDKAAIVTGLCVLRELQKRSSSAVFRLVCSCDEEVNFRGIDYLVPNIVKPDAAIVLESTDLDLATAHKGNSRWEVRVDGVSHHASMLPGGDNAVYKAARMVLALERFALVLNTSTQHPLLGHPTLNVGTIHGGLQANSVPDRCTFQIDRRMLPEESKPAVVDELTRILSPYADHFELNELFFSEPFELNPAHPWYRHCAGIVKMLRPEAVCKGLHCATEAARLGKHGIPTVIFGAGSIANAHSVSEQIRMEDIETAVRIVTGLVQQANGARLL